MSKKERIIQLIEDVPEQKLLFIVHMLEDLKGYEGKKRYLTNQVYRDRLNVRTIVID